MVRFMWAALAAGLLWPASVEAQGELQPGVVQHPPDFAEGFAELREQVGRSVMGWPIEPEHQAADADAVQLTTRGIAVWRRGEPPRFHDGEKTYELQPGQVAARVPVDALSRRVECIIQRESRGYALAVNPRRQASGLGQFLPSTWRTTPAGRAGLSVFDPAANRAMVRWMLEVGRGREFATIGGC